MDFDMENMSSTSSSSGISPERQPTVIPQPMSQSPSGSHHDQMGNVNTGSEEDSQKKRKGRKGHTKSRMGCFNCKRARIKCKENKPDCDYCAHRGLRCEWPDPQVNHHPKPDDGSPGSSQVVRRGSWDDQQGQARPRQSLNTIPEAVQTQGPVFNMQDFRLFNYFVQSAYPHHPIGNDSVWRHEIPCIASDYEFLLHSMLALAASELACTTDPTPQMHSTALTHRVKAISSLNNAIGGGVTCYQEGNAMLATCFSLLFQSCLLEDGLMEYMMFIRGLISIGFTMGGRQMPFIFNKLFDQEQLEQVDPMMHGAPLIQPEVVAAANRSFERFATLCVRKVEKDVYNVLSGIARALTTSSRDAYLGLRKMYQLFSYTMAQAEFEQYCDHSCVACQLLQAHFVALQLIMAPVTRAEFKYKEQTTGKKDDDYGKTVAWLVGIHRRVPNGLKKYFTWTTWVQEEVLSGRLYNAGASEEDLGGLKEAMGEWNDDWRVIMNVQDERE